MSEKKYLVDGDYLKRTLITTDYKDTSYALAELIDNSIESAVNINEKCNSEIICVEKNFKLKSNKIVKRIREILIYDDAGGMDKEMLEDALRTSKGSNINNEVVGKGKLGKYGIGLPQASIGTSDKVEIYSWQNNKKPLFVEVDRNKITQDLESLVAPTAVEKEIPDKYLSLISSDIKPHGTLVIWADVTRATWTTNKGLFNNAENTLGRLFRNYINDKTINIKLKAYEETNDNLTLFKEHVIRPNDPLYLSSNSNFPTSDNNKKDIFELYSEKTYPVKIDDNKTANVRIKFTFCSKEERERYANKQSRAMTHLANNIGVSICRSGRELVTNNSWSLGYTPTERWWGCEIDFDKDLDVLFGVTKDKQRVKNLNNRNLKEEAEANGFTDIEFKEDLIDKDEGALTIYEISQYINTQLSAIRKMITKQTKGSNSGQGVGGGTSAAATVRGVKVRIGQGNVAEGDGDDMPDKDKEISIKDKLKDSGLTEEQINNYTRYIIEKDLNYIFISKEIVGSVLFDFQLDRNLKYIVINTKHPMYEYFYGLVEEQDLKDEEEPKSLTCLRIIISSWIRMEEETSETQREDLEEIRSRWGFIAKQIFNEIPQNI